MWIPLSDREGTDIGANGIFDALDSEDSATAVIGWAPAVSNPAQERRIAFEVDTRPLYRTFLVKEARFSIFPDSVSGGPRVVQLYGYLGNGAVEVQDMSVSGSLTTFTAATTAPVSLDVRTFMQTAATQQYPFTGFLLRLETVQATDSIFNLQLPTSNNTALGDRPRLDMIYCVDINQDGQCD